MVGVVVAVAAYCEATRGGVVACREITRWRGEPLEGLMALAEMIYDFG